jgi:DNA-binding beta-propeller fold protein YncE
VSGIPAGRKHALRLLRVALLVAGVLVTTYLVEAAVAGRAGIADAAKPIAIPREGEAMFVPEIVQTSFDIAAVRGGHEGVAMALSEDGTLGYYVSGVMDGLFVIDLETNQIVDAKDLWSSESAPAGPAPRWIVATPDGERLVVAGYNDGSILVLDTGTLDVEHRVVVGGDIQDLAVSPDGTTAYVAQGSPTTMFTAVDIASGTIQATSGTDSDYSLVMALAFSLDGQWVYGAARNGMLAVVDAATCRITSGIPFPAGYVTDIVLSPDGCMAYVSVQDTGKIHVLDLLSRSLSSTYDVALPCGLALSADGTCLYVGTFGFLGHAQYNVLMLDALTGTLLHGGNYWRADGLIFSDNQHLMFSADEETLYVPSNDGRCLLLLESETLEPIGYIPFSAPLEFAPEMIAASPDGARVYVSSETRSPTTVTVLDTALHEEIGEFSADCLPLGAGCGDIALSPDGATLYVVTPNDRGLLVGDTRTLEFTECTAIEGGEGLFGIAVSGDGLTGYVLDYSGTVFVVDLHNLAVTTSLETGVVQAGDVVIGPEGERLYVSGRLSYAVVDLATLEVLTLVTGSDYGELTDATRPFAFLPASSQYLVADRWGFSGYDAADDEELWYVNLFDVASPLRPLTADIAITADGDTAYFVEPDEAAVIALDTATWTHVVGRIDVGRMAFSGLGPQRLAFNADESELFVTCTDGDRVLVIDTESNEVVDVIRLDGAPNAGLLRPCGVAATDGTEPAKVRVSWSAVEGAVSYAVHRGSGSDGPFLQIAEATESSYDDLGVTLGQLYWYKVAACGESGCSGLSASDRGYATATSANTAAAFRVTSSGEVRADGSFSGAGLFSGSADVAEWAPVSERVEPGDVLELDRAHPGSYRLAQTPCSLAVAGVVSTEPGVVLGGAGSEGMALLALSGIVPVKVTNEGGPIQPGDLLVSSSTPGYAMRWAGPESCPCALVGKALEPMTDEQGVISVLLTAH